MIPALVLTAGLATRLRPLSLVRAKASLPVAGEPLIRRILRQLAAAGVTDAVLNLHHMPETIAAVVGDGQDLGLRVRYSWEVPLLGSAGGPRRALRLLGAPSFFVLNGDTLTDCLLDPLLAAHRNSGALVTMALVPNREPLKYGGARMDDSGAITGFVGRGSSDPSFHFIGVQVAEAAAFASVPDDTPWESVGTLYPALIAARPGSIRGLVTTASFADIGTPDDYRRTSLRISALEGHDPLAGATIAPTASVTESVLWPGASVGADVVLDGCVVTDGVTIPAATHWQHVTIRAATGEVPSGEVRIGDLFACPL